MVSCQWRYMPLIVAYASDLCRAKVICSYIVVKKARLEKRAQSRSNKMKRRNYYEHNL